MATISLVTGANKGIGIAIARRLARTGHFVWLGARDATRGRTAQDELRAEGLQVEHVSIDVTEPLSIAAAARTIEARHGRLDVLVNNAAVLFDRAGKCAELDFDVVRRTLDANVAGLVETTRVFLMLLRKSEHARIVNLSSGGGTFAKVDAGGHSFAPAYQLSKTAVNMYTLLLGEELAGSKVLVNACSPGWIRTDMGTDEAPRTVEEGADTPVWLATLPDDGPSGGFFAGRARAPW